MPFRSLAVAILALAVSLASAAAGKKPARLQITIEGLSSSLEEAAGTGLTLQQYREREVTGIQLRRLVSVGEKEILAVLEAWGHYEGKVTSRIEKLPDGGFHVWFDVMAGEPVRVT